MKDHMQDLQWLASEIENINDIGELNKIIQTAQGIPALLANDRKTKLMQYQQQAQGQQALAQGQQPPVMAQIKGQAAQQEAARQQAQMQQLAALQAPPEMGLAALPYDEEDEESPEYQSTEDESAEEGEGAAMGGLVALAQGGPVDGQDEKDFGDKYMDAVMAPLQEWRKIYGLAHGGPVRGFSGEEESYVSLEDPEHDATKRLIGPASDVRAGEFLTPKESDFNYFKPWPSETEGYPKKHIPTARDYYDQATGAVSDIWDTIKRGASQMADVKVRKDETPKQVSEFLPSVRRADEPSAVKRVEQTAEPEAAATGWNPPQIAENDDPWSMGLRSLGTTPLRPGQDSVASWDPSSEPQPKSELQRHAETEKNSDQTRAPGARTVADTPNTQQQEQTPAAPPAGGQTVAALDGDHITEHPHGEEIVKTIEDPKASWEEKVKTLQAILGPSYQMSPELLSKYEKQLADMKSEKGMMTGLSFLTGMLGARTPWLSQAISEGGLQALGTYGRYGEDENKLKQAMLEQQIGAERAPVEARQKAGLEFLKQQMEGQKQAADLKKYLAGTQLRNMGNINVQQLRNSGAIKKAAYDRDTRLTAEALRLTGKDASDRNKVRTTAQQTLAGNVQYFRELDPIKQAQMVEDVTDFYMRKNAAAGNQNMGNIGGTGQRVVIPNL